MLPSLEVSSADHIQGVVYLRGLAALAVAWFHLTNQYTETSWVRISGSFGWLGVEIFFVISGFVVPWSLRRWSRWTLASYLSFAARRWLRITLPYVASIILTLGLWVLSTRFPGFGGGPPDITTEHLALHLFFLIPFTDLPWWQPVYWTLAYETAFYLILGLLFFLCISSRGGDSTRFLLLCLATSAATAFALIPIYWPLFLMGAAVFRHKSGGGSDLSLWLAVAMAGLSMLWAGGDLQAIVGIGTVVALVFLADPRLPMAFSAVLGWLGAISYSLYLVHVPVGGRVVNLGRRVVPDTATAELALSAIAIFVSLVAAWLFYVAIEKPAHGFSRRVR